MIFKMLLFMVIVSTFYIVIGTNYIKINYIKLKTKKMNIKIAHISDIHGKLRFLNGSLSSILNQFQLEYLVVTGDLTNNGCEIERIVNELKKVHVKEKILVVLGNNERSVGVRFKKRALDIDESYFKSLNDMKFRFLINDYEIYSNRGQKILFYGFDNSIYGNEKYSDNLLSEKFEYKIMLAHSPNIIKYLKCNSLEYDMVLVGHTHGNQINIPLIRNVKNDYSKFHSGYKIIEGKKINISRGLGNSLVPIRINSFPQITVFDFE